MAQPGALPALGTPADAAASRIAKLEQQCSRLAHELSAVSCDADRRDGEYRDQIHALVKRLSECETELADRELRLVTVTQSYEALRSQVEGGNVPTAAAVDVYRREIRRNSEVAMSLRKRLDERALALDLAGEQIAALHDERARLIDALRERTQQVVELVAQLTRGEVRDGFGIEFQTGLGRLVERAPSLSSGDAGAVGWNTPGVNEQTIVLENTSTRGATPPPAAAPASAAAADASTRDEARRRGPRLRRYLLPVDSSADAPYELTGPRSYVGRGVEADVCLGHPTISRLHGVLYRVGGSTIVEDARSSNGVFVNRERVQQAVLKDGDIVSFGNVAFWFRVAISDD